MLYSGVQLYIGETLPYFCDFVKNILQEIHIYFFLNNTNNFHYHNVCVGIHVYVLQMQVMKVMRCYYCHLLFH